jgi:hypothetical protein
MTLEDMMRSTSVSSNSVLEIQLTLWESYGASEQSSNQLQLRSKQPYSDFLAKTYKGEIPPTVCFNVLTRLVGCMP